jgi:DNA-directed RNA polymerase specialized sigma24 family protein
MTSTSPALHSPPADRINHTGTPTGRRHSEPGGEPRPNLQSPDPQYPDPQSPFDLHLSRHHELLYFIACRILNCPQEAEEAVKNCLRTAASRNPPDSSSEGAVKSWLVRILIDEATLLLGKKQSNPAPASRHLPDHLSEAG